MGSQIIQSSFLNGQNAAFIAGLFKRYQADPAAVDPSWQAFFATMGGEARTILSEIDGASWSNGNGYTNGVDEGMAEAFLLEVPPDQPATDPAMEHGQASKKIMPGASEEDLRRATLDSIQAIMMIRAYRVRGHMLADLDPLGIEQVEDHPELDPASYGFTEDDYDRPIFINNVLGLYTATLREIIERLRETYCGSIGVEYSHIQDPEEKAWLQSRIEAIHNRTDFSQRGRVAIYERLTAAETFERFLNVKHTGTKRFGLDGGESLVPALEQIMKRGSQLGVKEIIIGMAHRGRLNVLANVMQKPFSAIFSEFQGTPANPDEVQGSGDVKYHLGTSTDREFDGKTVHLSLTANPSHLEAVDPVVVGKVRAKQMQHNDTEREKILGLLLHGDAAFAGQGIVSETFMLSELRGYRTGGTIHFVINNQIGFTTSPSFSRPGRYPTDIALALQAPIFHVNGDDPEAVVHVSRIAIEYRQQFKKDVVIDMFCYRRHGHNEGDEPAFTQPLMYKKIAKLPSTREIHGERLVKQGVLKPGEPEKIVEDFRAHLEQEFEAATSYKPNKADWLGGSWEGMSIASGDDRRGRTSVTAKEIRAVGKGLTTYPDGFAVNPKIVRQLKAKQKMLETGTGIDWGTAEALAFGTLLKEGYPVRLSGQDSGRGTFSHRHSVLVDQATEDRYVPLQNLSADQAQFEVHDSPLSEFAVLGFEYGFTLSEPNALVIWEAQFGDFANSAQIMFDQFICSGESKWLRMSGLVMLLPHGFEGQGPEHSSARLERFLQSSAEDNWQVINPTTPANYFHALRRQLHREFRKPLVVMTPKSLLRHKACVSDLDMFTGASTFHRVLYEDKQLVADKDIKRVVLCSGKVYYDLAAERDERGIDNIAILRLEQLFPFPHKVLGEELVKRYPNADVIWCQEEPQNMGAWTFVDRKIEAVLTEFDHKYKRPVYVGRCEASSPATGVARRHAEQQADLVNRALTF